LFVDGIAAKQLIAPAVNTPVGDPKKVFEASYTQVHDALRALVKRAVKGGDIRKDLDPVDPWRFPASQDWSRRWRRRQEREADILIAGSRPVK